MQCSARDSSSPLPKTQTTLSPSIADLLPPSSLPHSDTATDAASAVSQNIMQPTRSVDTTGRPKELGLYDKQSKLCLPNAHSNAIHSVPHSSEEEECKVEAGLERTNVGGSEATEYDQPHRRNAPYANDYSASTSVMTGETGGEEVAIGRLQINPNLSSSTESHPLPLSPGQHFALHGPVSHQGSGHASFAPSPGEGLLPPHQEDHQHTSTPQSVGVAHFSSAMTAQSAPASVTTFAGAHSSPHGQTSPLYPGYTNSYFHPPQSAYAHSFVQQQQQHTHQQQSYEPSVHPHTAQYSNQFSSVPGIGLSAPSYMSPPAAYTGNSFEAEGAKSPQQQLPQHYYHSGIPSPSDDLRRTHLSASGAATSRSSGSAGYQPYCVPSQFQRSPSGMHSNQMFTASSIFTANPDSLPDLRYSDGPFNTGAQYGRLPNGKIIELFPAMMRTIQACEYCRSRKAKCTGGLPCERCEKKNIKCEYAQLDKKRKVKTTTSQFDMSAGAGSNSSSASAQAQAILSAKVGLSTLRHGESKDDMQLRSSKKRSARPLFMVTNCPETTAADTGKVFDFLPTQPLPLPIGPGCVSPCVLSAPMYGTDSDRSILSSPINEQSGALYGECVQEPSPYFEADVRREDAQLTIKQVRSALTRHWVSEVDDDEEHSRDQTFSYYS